MLLVKILDERCHVTIALGTAIGGWTLSVNGLDGLALAGIAESAVNQVISKRMVKKQQMHWTESGAHNLLQIRTKVLNNQLRETFVRWYPGMQNEQELEIQKKAA
jgi:hypothetical protein